MHEHPGILGKKGLAEWDAATKGRHLPEHSHMAHKEYATDALGGHHAEEHHGHKKHHAFHRTTITHHPNGSHTVEHEHEEGAHKNVSYAVPDLDGVHDGLETNVGEPNPGEAEAEAGNPGIEAAEAGAAGAANA